MSLIYGFGVTDIKTRNNGVQDREYQLWVKVLSRCYSERILKAHPTYVGCEMSKDWLFYSKFKEDVNGMMGFGLDQYHLDKDILFKGNKLYSRETCSFVPIQINNIFVNKRMHRGDTPVGVRFRVDSRLRPYEAQMSVNGKRFYLGCHKTAEDAFYAYKTCKEKYIKEMAEKYKGSIEDSVYNALMSYEVSIND